MGRTRSVSSTLQAVQYSTVRYKQSSPVQYSTVQHSTVHYPFISLPFPPLPSPSHPTLLHSRIFVSPTLPSIALTQPMLSFKADFNCSSLHSSLFVIVIYHFVTVYLLTIVIMSSRMHFLFLFFFLDL